MCEQSCSIKIDDQIRYVQGTRPAISDFPVRALQIVQRMPH